jgi:hypothetical protein
LKAPDLAGCAYWVIHGLFLENFSLAALFPNQGKLWSISFKR